MKTIAEALAPYPELAQQFANKELFIKWATSQLFGQRAEQRAHISLPQKDQLWLLEDILPVPEEAPAPEITVAAHQRTRRKNPVKLKSEDSQLRFGENVPVEVITVIDDEALKIPEDKRVLVSDRVVHKLATRSSNVVLEYHYQTYKRKSDGELFSPRAVDSVIPGSVADVSFLASMLVDKFCWHLPLYRQHRRLQDSLIFLDRSTLTRLMGGSIQHLEPIYQALQSSILLSTILGADESPTPAGVGQGKMKKGYFWTFYGDQDEVFFLFSPSRGAEVLRNTLKGFQGVLLTDGYVAYESFVSGQSNVLHAQCWAHTRRNFVQAETIAPQQCKTVLANLQQLYALERQAELGSEKLRAIRDEQSRPLLEKLFTYLEQQIAESCFLPSNKFVRAIQYALDRKAALQIFLDNPKVPLDTNHVERAIRAPVIGRKNWMFHTTETGARNAAIVYSLIESCKLAKVNPLVYLTDVLQRIQTHPSLEVAMLTPRNWAKHFADNPMRSVLERIGESPPPARVEGELPSISKLE